MAPQKVMPPRKGFPEKSSGSHPVNSTPSRKERKRQRLAEESLSSLPPGNHHSETSDHPLKKAKVSESSEISITQAGQSLHDSTGTIDLDNQPSGPATTDLFTGDLKDLANSYDITYMNIISSTKMEAKITKILSTLSNFSFAAPAKPTLVILHAKATCASKMISISDIAKREIAKKGGKWFQYSRLEQDLQVKQRTPSLEPITTILGRAIDADSMVVDAPESGSSMEVDESTFETMKTPLERSIEGRPKVRAVPVMTIYLCRVRIEKLKITYGEQTNATSMPARSG